MITKQGYQTNATTDRHRFLQRRVNRLLAVKFFLERQGYAMSIGVAGTGLLVPSMEAFQTGMVALGLCVGARVGVEMRLAAVGLQALQVSIRTAIVDPDEEE